jgi:anti-sigma factor ChrR (cupin superfamily)
MTSADGRLSCIQSELVSAFALGALPASERAVVEGHIGACLACQEELASLQAVIGSFDAWPMDVLQPSTSLWDRLACRIAAESGLKPAPAPEIDEPQWEDTAPGISCKLLASDNVNDRVSMLVRLAPGAHYPPHTHAGLEELHLLDGELWIDERKLVPGDYNRAEAGTADQRVWSETGCTCVLITSVRDRLVRSCS